MSNNQNDLNNLGNLNEIFGTITINNRTFRAGYRTNGDLNHQGGYQKCLKIYGRYSYDYFKDDKFQVKSSQKTHNGDILLKMESFFIPNTFEYVDEIRLEIKKIV